MPASHLGVPFIELARKIERKADAVVDTRYHNSIEQGFADLDSEVVLTITSYTGTA